MKNLGPFEATEFERQLLGSAEHDDPAPGLAARVVAAVGVGGGVLTAASAASGAGTVGLVIAKSAGIGFAVGLLVSTGTAEVFLGSSLRSAPTPSAVSLPAAPAEVASNRVVAEVATARASARFDEPEAAAHLRPPRGASGRPAPPVAVPAKAALASAAPVAVAVIPEESSLTAEVRALDEARGALREGNPGGALVLLERLRGSVLAAEATVLRVEALLALGQRAAAERDAAPILAANPNALHATRIRALLR
jgi:hypothetical protein